MWDRVLFGEVKSRSFEKGHRNRTEKGKQSDSRMTKGREGKS